MIEQLVGKHSVEMADLKAQKALQSTQIDWLKAAYERTAKELEEMKLIVPGALKVSG